MGVRGDAENIVPGVETIVVIAERNLLPRETEAGGDEVRARDFAGVFLAGGDAVGEGAHAGFVAHEVGEEAGVEAAAEREDDLARDGVFPAVHRLGEEREGLVGAAGAPLPGIDGIGERFFAELTGGVGDETRAGRDHADVADGSVTEGAVAEREVVGEAVGIELEVAIVDDVVDARGDGAGFFVVLFTAPLCLASFWALRRSHRLLVTSRSSDSSARCRPFALLCTTAYRMAATQWRV